MQVLNNKFLFNDKPSLGKKATEDKAINFYRESEY